MHLTATIRSRPGPGAVQLDDVDMDVITATADDYDTAYAELVAQADRRGWRLLSLRTH
jgi:hypothetical protein|nr:hypothetical protein [Aeromicrobium sp.]